jgi:hypothetical protein
MVTKKLIMHLSTILIFQAKTVLQAPEQAQKQPAAKARNGK